MSHFIYRIVDELCKVGDGIFLREMNKLPMISTVGKRLSDNLLSPVFNFKPCAHLLYHTVFHVILFDISKNSYANSSLEKNYLWLKKLTLRGG